MNRETRRRKWCQEKARAAFYAMDDGRRSFEEILSAIRRRWPVSCADDEFADRLRTIFDREQTQRAAYHAELADRLLDKRSTNRDT